MDKTHEELATRLKTENEELRKRNKLLYRALEEIRDVSNAQRNQRCQRCDHV